VISVVIVNYNAWPDVLRVVATLATAPEVAAGRAEVVVVDNASQGAIPAELRDLPDGVRLIARGDNGGFAAGVNAGWHAARGRWLLVLNPDVVVAPGWLGAVVDRTRHFDNDGEPPGVVGFGLRNADGSHQGSVGAFPSLPRTLWEQLIPRPRRKYQADWRTRPGPVAWVTGACMLVNAELLAVLGGMDEDFFLYYEEVALCRSAWGTGWRVEYDPTLAVTHLRPLQNRAVSPKMRVITRHSKLLYFSKHLPRWQLVGLSWVITLEALVLGWWSSWMGRAEEQASWRTIGAVARAFRTGWVPRGQEVRRIAEALIQPTGPSPAPQPRRGPWRPSGARKRSGVRSS
jgi:GT2 family glycosyltransferase